MFRINRLILGLLFLPLAGMGCGSSGNPNLVPVTGTVLHQGSPVSDASVVFRAGDAVATAMTDSSGRFSLQTVGHGSGALPGTYRVMVVKVPDIEVTSEDISDVTQDEWPDAADEPDNLLPPQYADLHNTPLEATVVVGEANNFTLELD